MATDTNNQVVETETRATDANAEAADTETRAADATADTADTETRPTDATADTADTETRATDVNATETNAGAVGTEPRPDLAWDDEVRGLCVRVYGYRAKSFIFVYRIGDRQRFIRIGQTPVWSLEAARIRAKELRSIVEQGRDPARENRGREIPPVENIIQYIASTCGRSHN
jgi:Tfp pilus assembly major pilin PilA